jgi:predicted transcriptional regulator
MSNKLDQMNIRLTSELKDKIQELAKERDVKTSDFVRQTLEDAIEGKSIERERNLFTANILTRERHILQAIAFIAHTDTGRPLVDCLKIALQEVKDQEMTEMVDPIKYTREERETHALKINTAVAEKLRISPLALTFIRLILTTYFGIIFNQDIFQLTPLSMETMGEIKSFLNQNK